MMKRFLSQFMLAGFALTALSGPVLAQETGKVCLSLRDISSTDPSKDGTSITFKMRNGVSWRNDLQGRCPDLWFNGFKWVIQSPEQVCENQETFRVLDSGQVCTLGKFTQMTPAP
jgi:ABC-type transport system substrate-binding protein